MDHIPQDQLGEDRRSQMRETCERRLQRKKTSSNERVCYTISAADARPLARARSIALSESNIVIGEGTATNRSHSIVFTRQPTISERKPLMVHPHQTRKHVHRIDSNLSVATSLSNVHLATRVSMVPSHFNVNSYNDGCSASRKAINALDVHSVR